MISRVALLARFALIPLAACGRLQFDGHAVNDAQAQDVATSSPDVLIDAPADPDLLFAHFPLDETTGINVPDVSGQGNNGTIINPVNVTWRPAGGRFGGSLHFDGVDYASFVRFPGANGQCATPSPGFVDRLTVMAWVRFELFQDWESFSLSDTAVMQGTAGGTDGSWGLGASNGCGATTAAVTVTPSTNSTLRVVRCGTTTLAPSVWYHLAAVYDGSAGRLDLYVDGVQESGAFAGLATIPPLLFRPATCPFLGAAQNQQALLVGDLDEVRVYARALTDTEVMDRFTAGAN